MKILLVFLLCTGVVFAENKFAQELKQELTKKLKKKAVKKTANELFDNKNIDHLLNLATSCKTFLSPSCLAEVLVAETIGEEPSSAQLEETKIACEKCLNFCLEFNRQSLSEIGDIKKKIKDLNIEKDHCYQLQDDYQKLYQNLHQVHLDLKNNVDVYNKKTEKFKVDYEKEMKEIQDLDKSNKELANQHIDLLKKLDDAYVKSSKDLEERFRNNKNDKDIHDNDINSINYLRTHGELWVKTDPILASFVYEAVYPVKSSSRYKDFLNLCEYVKKTNLEIKEKTKILKKRLDKMNKLTEEQQSILEAERVNLESKSNKFIKNKEKLDAKKNYILKQNKAWQDSFDKLYENTKKFNTNTATNEKLIADCLSTLGKIDRATFNKWKIKLQNINHPIITETDWKETK